MALKFENENYIETCKGIKAVRLQSKVQVFGDTGHGYLTNHIYGENNLYIWEVEVSAATKLTI